MGACRGAGRSWVLSGSTCHRPGPHARYLELQPSTCRFSPLKASEPPPLSGRADSAVTPEIKRFMDITLALGSGKGHFHRPHVPFPWAAAASPPRARGHPSRLHADTKDPESWCGAGEAPQSRRDASTRRDGGA